MSHALAFVELHVGVGIVETRTATPGTAPLRGLGGSDRYRLGHRQ